MVSDFLCACPSVVSQQQDQSVWSVSLSNGNIAMDKIANHLTAFPKHSHLSCLLQLEGGLHFGISASLHVNLQVLTDRMTANDRRKNHTGSNTVLRNDIWQEQETAHLHTRWWDQISRYKKPGKILDRLSWPVVPAKVTLARDQQSLCHWLILSPPYSAPAGTLWHCSYSVSKSCHGSHGFLCIYLMHDVKNMMELFTIAPYTGPGECICICWSHCFPIPVLLCPGFVWTLSSELCNPL